MIAVSNGWRAVQNKTLLPEMFVEITYTVTEPGLQEEAVATGNYPEAYSNAGQITSLLEKRSEAYSTLDYGCWGLDGSFSYFDGSPEDPGYVDKNYSTDTGSLDVSPYPTVTIDFESRHDVSIPGLIITWSEVFGGWAEEFRVTARNAARVVAQITITGNKSPVSPIWLEMAEYSQITIEVLKWSHPYQRVRCSEVHLGVENVYTKSDLIGYEHSQSADLLAAVLPSNSITFKLRNDDNRWNPDNPTGFEKYLIEQQEVRVRYGMDVNGRVEWIKGGTFWLSEWSTPANGMEAVFTARDALGFTEIAYQGARTGSLYDIATEALFEANIPTLDDGSVRYVIHESLQSIMTDFSADDSDYTVAEVLQMVAHAGCCVFYQDRDGVLRIEPRSEAYSGYMIEPGISYAHPEYTMNKPLKAVSVSYGDKLHSVVEAATRGEIQTVDNPFIVTAEDATRVGIATKKVLEQRKTITGDFRADLRMDVLDNVIVVSKYAANVLAVTEIKYSTTGGAFKGTYTGRVVSIPLEPISWFSGEIYSGEVM